LWTPDKLERQLLALKENLESAVAYSWTQTIDEQGSLLHKYHPVFLKGDIYSELLLNNFIASGSNILARREAVLTIGDFDPALEACEDWDFYIRLAAKYHFVVVPDWQILYRQSSTAMTSKVDIMEAFALIVLEKAYRLAPSKYQHLKKKSLAWVYEYATQQHLRCSTELSGTELSSLKMATHKFWQAVRLRPRILLEGYGQSLMRRLSKRWFLALMPFKR
jgi:GT2 family glycosyltransferase